MSRGSPDLTAIRKEEIINACEQLYQSMNFKEITLKEIGTMTSFSRPSIYNYFETKEEIFLALYEREYQRWNSDLINIMNEHEHLTREELASEIAKSLSDRVQLLKLMAMNNYDMEANSRVENLISFKHAYGASIQIMHSLLAKFCPEMSSSDIQNFTFMFFPFMFGIYPYTAVTEKQQMAMKEAAVDFKFQSVYELTFNFLIKVLTKG